MQTNKFLIVGLGNIGSGLARTAINKFPGQVSVWNRSIDKADALFKSEETPHFTKYSSIVEAITTNETIIISLFNYDSCYDALSQSPNDFSVLSDTVKLLKNKTVVQLTYVLKLFKKPKGCANANSIQFRKTQRSQTMA